MATHTDERPDLVIAAFAAELRDGLMRQGVAS